MQNSLPSVSAISSASLDSFREPPVTMMRSTPAAQARARTAGMSAEWHCFPWYIPLNMPSVKLTAMSGGRAGDGVEDQEEGLTSQFG